MTLSAGSFGYLRELLRARTGFLLGDDKAYLAESRLSPLAARRGFASVEELVLRLRAGRAADLIDLVLDAMTINETSFFRDGFPFDALREVVIPELLRRRAGERRLRVWSAACSTGQEPYSLALLLRAYFPGLQDWDIWLRATDVSPTALDRARKGWFSELEVSRGLPTELRSRYFHPSVEGWELAEEVRQMVEFRTMNLVDPWPPLPRLDLVLLRNVLIYFDLPTRQRILARVRELLQPDGYLLLGGAETTHNLDEEFELVSIGPVTLSQPRRR